MIIQLINIVGGVVGASSLIKAKISHKDVHGALDTARPYEVTIGSVAVVVGVIALIERLGIIHLGLPLGSSYSQALAALLVGLTLGASYFERFAFLKPVIAALVPYRSWLGLIAIAVGLGSLLFGCVLPAVCGTPF